MTIKKMRQRLFGTNGVRGIAGKENMGICAQYWGGTWHNEAGTHRRGTGYPDLWFDVGQRH